jgi:Tol biopolymer transport system component/DNA-binding winged helix-turn-helix (wHTH) protein
MPVTHQLVRFGVFELDLTSGELCKSGRRLRLQEQPFRLLALLLEYPGQVVTRGKLKEALWPADTFVDFDHSLNAAVAKLRQALGDSAENPRFIETLARRGYRFIAPVNFAGNPNGAAKVMDTGEPPAFVAHALMRAASRPIPPPGERSKRAPFPIYLSGALLLVLIASLVFWNRRQSGETELIKLTDDAGVSMNPAISQDGNLLAYASDRGSSGNLNIWVQQLGSGAQPVQLTHFDVDADAPAFSPDGATIAFSSKKDGGGIYTVPVIGGEPTRLTNFGRSPRFSPDGRWIAYSSSSVPTLCSCASTLKGGTGVHVVSASGGEPRRLAPDLLAAADPVWSPDSKHLLVYAPPPTVLVWDQADWWLAAVDKTPSMRTGNFRALLRQGFSLAVDRVPHVSQWTGDSLVFTAGLGDTTNIWRAPVSDKGWITGRAERLTSGTTLEASPALTPDGGLIFSSLNRHLAVWSLSADPDHATVTGDLKMITTGSSEVLPSLSADGRILAFNAAPGNARLSASVLSSPGAINSQVRVKDLSTGKETVISTPGVAPWDPQISRDGRMVAYTSSKPAALYVAASSGGPVRRVFAGKKVWTWDWSLDNQRLLFSYAYGSKTDLERVYSIDPQSGKESLFLEKPGFALYQAKFSPDDLAVAVLAARDDDSRLFIVPVERGVPKPPDSWIPIDHQGHWDDKPRWSPDGNLLYFLSDRDDYFCLWAQRVLAPTKQPVGAPFPVYHFHNARLSAANLFLNIAEIGVAKDKIIFGLGELTGNIWSLRRK